MKFHCKNMLCKARKTAFSLSVGLTCALLTATTAFGGSLVYGRPFHEKEGTLHRLAPFASERNELRFTVLDGGEELRKARDYIAAIKI